MRRRLIDYWIAAGIQPALGAGALSFDAAKRTGMTPWSTAGFTSAAIGGTLALYGGRRLLQFTQKSCVPESNVSDHAIQGTLVVAAALLAFGATAIPGTTLVNILAWGLIGVAYSTPIFGKRLREYGALKPALLALAWTAITCPPVTDATSAGLFAERLPALFALCLLFDGKDVRIDREAGVLTPAVLLSPTRLRIIAAAFALESVAITARFTPANARAPAILGLLLAATLPPYRSASHRSWVLRGDGALIALGLIPALLR